MSSGKKQARSLGRRAPTFGAARAGMAPRIAPATAPGVRASKLRNCRRQALERDRLSQAFLCSVREDDRLEMSFFQA